MKKDFLLKFKDYNKELEKILEHKDFSQDVKSLLLSMFYKLEISYNDYFLVKRKCKTKEEYLDNILESIKITNNIRLVNPNEPQFNDLKEHGLYKIDFKLKIIIVLENEFAMLSALIGMNEFQINVDEQYNLTRKSISYLLNTAYEMEKIEVLRDFNAWSWNTTLEQIKDININLIYQNLKIALNDNIFEKAEHSYDIDIINNIKQTLLEKYNNDVVELFLYLIFKTSVLIYIKEDEEERKRLLEEKNKKEIELSELNDKKTYVENITKEKRKLSELLKKIDLTLNNKKLLLEEYERRNKKLPEYNKIFNVSHLVEKLQKERKIILSKINICNQKGDPTTYLNNRKKIQQEYSFLKNIDFEEKNNIYKYIDKIQEMFIKEIFAQKIKNATKLNEIIDCIYELRYYNFLPYSNYKEIKDLDFIQEELEKAKELLIKKLYEYKIINTISTNLENDIKIVKKIFDLKIINMENIYVQIKKNKSKYIIIFYDEKDTKDKEFEIELKFNKKDKIKLNKKIKLFKTE